VGLEPDGTEIVICGRVQVGIECCGEEPQQGYGGLSATLFDAFSTLLTVIPVRWARSAPRKPRATRQSYTALSKVSASRIAIRSGSLAGA
jgi:hypothetical protein